MSVVKILRVLRVLRPLRAINRAKGLKVFAFIMISLSCIAVVHTLNCIMNAVKLLIRSSFNYSRNNCEYRPCKFATRNCKNTIKFCFHKTACTKHYQYRKKIKMIRERGAVWDANWMLRCLFVISTWFNASSSLFVPSITSCSSLFYFSSCLQPSAFSCSRLI